MIEKIVKPVLAVLFFLCLLDMPYGYYQIVRLVGLIGFVILAYEAYNHGRPIEMIIFCGLVLLFQPIFKIPVGRQIWNTVDIIVGAGLLLSMVIRPQKK